MEMSSSGSGLLDLWSLWSTAVGYWSTGTPQWPSGLIIPRSQLSSYRSSRFAVCGPAAWNSLPAATPRPVFITILFLQPCQD